ncbi:MAG: ABC transporter ATP-binding protein [Hyphomicrobiaceae bacterium]
MTTVEFADVSKHYGDVRAVDGVSLRVETGEFATILGPSGSGKTTMLSLIAGIAGPTSGAIKIGGRDVTNLKAADRNVGLVFQSYALFPHMTVADNVAFPLRVRRVAKPEIAARVKEALALVRLEDYGQRKPSQLSGGQQQRVALARAIVFKPDILLLDEPLAALDRKLREDVRAEIHSLQRRLGITTLMVTHDQDEALSLSDRIVVLDQGRVQQIDTPFTAYHQPRNRFVAGFLGLANFLEGELETQGSTAVIRLKSGDALACGPSRSTAGAVCGVLRPEDVGIVNGGGGGLVSGKVRESVFFGESVRYAVTLDSGFELIAHVPGSRSKLPEGAHVALEWEPDRVWLLPGEA